METGLILIDTNIVIELLKNNQEIVQTIRKIGVERMAVSSITVMELYYGAFNKVELEKIKKYIKAFELIQIDRRVSQLAIDLIETYAKSHHLNLPDSLIAATSIENNFPLFTLNLKDFRYIKGLTIWQ